MGDNKRGGDMKKFFIVFALCFCVLSEKEAFATPQPVFSTDQKVANGLKLCITQPLSCTNGQELSQAFSEGMTLAKTALDSWLDMIYGLIKTAPLPVPAPTPQGMPQPQDIPEVQIVPVPQPGSPTPTPYTP